MGIETKLLKYKKEMEDIEKGKHREEGSLNQLFESLKKDLGIEGKPDKLIKETKKMLKKIDSQKEVNSEKLEEIMEKLETEYKKFEREE